MTEVMGGRVSEWWSYGGFSSNKWSRYKPSSGHASGTVCRYWLAGKCTRKPCRFLHPDDKLKQSHDSLKPVGRVFKRSSPENTVDNKRGSTEKNSVEKKKDVLHSCCSGNGLTKIAQLEGHQKAVTGIYLTADSDKLFTSSKDGTVRYWNCHTGECVSVADVGAPVWCLASEEPWLLGGVTNVIKAWNIVTNVELTLDAPGGHVRSLHMVDGVLFGGLEDGSIFTWKMNSNAMSFEGPTVLKGHTGAVISLVWGAGRLYSSSMDKTIRVWDMEKMACINTLQKHSREATSLLCWDYFLLSSSLDKTLKFWGNDKAGELEVVYNHIEQHGILSLSGFVIAGDPVLFCSIDKTVRLYDLPTFKDRGSVFTKEKVATVHAGHGGLFFTGDETGGLSVWKYSRDVL